MVKMLTVLVNTISNLQVFLLKKNVSSFCKCKSYSHFISKNICVYAIFNYQNFNDTLTNDIVSFVQLGPGLWALCQRRTIRSEYAIHSCCGRHFIYLFIYFKTIRRQPLFSQKKK